MKSYSYSYGQERIATPSGGWARLEKIDERWGGGARYTVGSRMWATGGGSIVGHADNQEALDKLLEKAESESAYSKRQAATTAMANVPAGYAVTSTGAVVLTADWDEIEGDL